MRPFRETWRIGSYIFGKCYKETRSVLFAINKSDLLRLGTSKCSDRSLQERLRALTTTILHQCN